MTIECEARDGAMIFHLTGELDSHSATDAQRVLLSKTDFVPLLVVLDLGGVEKITSAGLRTILTLIKKVETEKGRISVTGLNSATKEIFEISGFARLIPIQKDLENALRTVMNLRA